MTIFQPKKLSASACLTQLISDSFSFAQNKPLNSVLKRLAVFFQNTFGGVTPLILLTKESTEIKAFEVTASDGENGKKTNCQALLILVSSRNRNFSFKSLMQSVRG